ncbi:hypothetical protein ACIGXM_03010 [Kitasatospora sp. NPDC052896]|uniref:hypothetical protein n=1 Tax=Kitasatospora sp. NPDC052896 TaxID=3364061 RepID=UPI0037C5A09E
MTATCHLADSEKGDRGDDPSEDAIAMLINDLSDGEQHVVVQPDEDGSAWHVAVAVLDTDQGCEAVVRRDVRCREHDDTASANASDVAHGIALWLRDGNRRRPSS